MLQQIEDKPKIKFCHIISRLKNKDPVGILKDDNASEVVENSKKAEYCNLFFASVFTRETKLQFDNVNYTAAEASPVLKSLVFPTSVVERELQTLKEARSASSDNIRAKFLKESASELSKPLAHCSLVLHVN
ncbi:unnamed protein product [Dibothriocephalus latus]|uniref:Uncharacterized protein n=1 Tax=Dibothriocephalus latus TaxID=60516 RepID=A0A3P7LLU8_DIBLA|nr:unnamed protein product [Dibothriocephalus latus]